MALILSAQSGNFNDGATWVGGVVPTVGDEARASNGHTITITANATCDEVSNAGTGIFTLNGGVTLTAFVTNKSATTNRACLQFTAASPATSAIVGNLTAGGVTGSTALSHSSSGTINITGNVTGGIGGNGAIAIQNTSNGTINITGNVAGGGSSAPTGHGLSNASSGIITIVGSINGGAGSTSYGVNNAGAGSVTSTGSVTGGGGPGAIGARNAGTGTFNITGNVLAGNGGNGATNESTGTLIITGNVSAVNGVHGVTSTNASAVNRFSGSFISSVNGTTPIYAIRFILNTIPSNSLSRFALNGTGTYVDMFTADNSLGQANPTDVRSGVSYASGNLTGRLTVPARGSVALSVNYGPSMPFTATRSGTTATATLTYSYPLVVGDQITVTGASNSEWNSSYTIASVVSGTSVTFTVPDTHSATAGTGATMQTTGTAALTPASIWDYALSSITASSTIGTLLKTNIDATISSRSTATTAGIADAVWDEVMSGHTVNGTYGDRIVRSLNSNNTLQLTGSHHAAADVHEFQPDVITNNAIAASAITEIATGVRTELATELTAITELHLIHGLKSGSTLTVTPTSRSAGAVSQTIGGDGTTSTTVSRD